MTKLVRNVITGAGMAIALAGAERAEAQTPEVAFNGVTVGSMAWHQEKVGAPQAEHVYMEPVQLSSGVTIKNVLPRTHLNLTGMAQLVNTDMMATPKFDNDWGVFATGRVGVTYTTVNGNQFQFSAMHFRPAVESNAANTSRTQVSGCYTFGK